MSKKELKDKDWRGIQINSVQANSLYYVNNGVEKAKLDRGKAVINGSLFSEYMRKHGVVVNRDGSSLDFLMMKYDYGTKTKNVEDKELAQISSNKLRQYYYENGATVNWEYTDKNGNVTKNRVVPYKMLMRSPGKAKEGECIFIKEELQKKALDYITMGLYEKMPFDNAKIVELSAYSTLITATAIDYITLPLDSMFVVKDAEASVFKKAVAVKTKDVQYVKH